MNFEFEYKSIEDLKAKINAWQVLNSQPNGFLLGDLTVELTGSWEFDNGTTWHGEKNWDNINTPAQISIKIGRKYVKAYIRGEFYTARPYMSTRPNDPLFKAYVKFSS